jgi:hypothetical protein
MQQLYEDQGQAMQIRVLLIVQDEKAKEKYVRAIEEEGVKVYTSASFTDLSEEICRQTFHGIFLDYATKLRALRLNKGYIYGLLEKFPICQLKIEAVSGRVRCFYPTGGAILYARDFIQKECGQFVPALIRSDPRKPIHLNILIYPQPESEDPEQSVTLNLSRSGCFLFSTRRWEVGAEVWIRIKEAGDPSLIQCQIRNMIFWGESMRIPGIGVEFKKILESQSHDLSDHLCG